MNRPDKRISEFIISMHDASMYLSASEFQEWTLKEIQSLIDFDFAIWGSGDGRSRQLHTATILHQVDSLFDTWEEVKHEDPYANLVIANTGKTWNSKVLPKFHHCRAYDEHWGRYDAKQLISTMEIDPKTGLHIFVTLARDTLDNDFSQADMALKNVITQHLFLAARHNDMHNLRSQQAPAAFVDRHGLLNAALPEFIALLTNEWGRKAKQQLPAEVTEALWTKGCYRNPRIVLNAQRFKNRLLVRAGICAAVSLSAREQDVAWAYVKGHTHKEVARLLDISPTTVRTHIARIYQKLEVSDKAELASWLHSNRFLL